MRDPSFNLIAKSSKEKGRYRRFSPLKKKKKTKHVESNLTSIEKMSKLVVRILYIPSRFDETKARDTNVISSHTNGYGLPTILFRPSLPNFRVYVSRWFSIEPRSTMERQWSRSKMRWNRTENHIFFFFLFFFFMDLRDTMINIDNFNFCYRLFSIIIWNNTNNIITHRL